MGKFKKLIKTLFQGLQSYKWATSQIQKQSYNSNAFNDNLHPTVITAPMKNADQTIIIILIILCTYTVPFLTITSCFKFSIPCKMVKGKNKHALLSFCHQPLENAFVF